MLACIVSISTVVAFVVDIVTEVSHIAVKIVEVVVDSSTASLPLCTSLVVELVLLGIPADMTAVVAKLVEECNMVAVEAAGVIDQRHQL